METSILVGLSAFSTFCGCTTIKCRVYLYIYTCIYIYIYILCRCVCSHVPVLSLLHIILFSPHFIGVSFSPVPTIQHSFGPWRKHRFLFRKTLWAVILGTWGRLLKNTKGIFSASKRINKQSKIKNKEPQPKRHCGENIPSKTFLDVRDSRSWVAITRRRSCSQTSGVLVPAAKEPIWTATYRKNKVHNFLIYIL